ncbi:MAG TPA: VOC family protein [Solirubrobacteraceae bacterium]|nr:VOC family protein [Solirubrobacteraceae bacterium]
MAIHPDTSVGTVRLTVSDRARSREFYERVIGLRATERDDGTLALGVEGNPALVELRADSAAPGLNRRATGLYHLAILLPTRHDLALALGRLAESRWPLDGASDHLVSEALYLSDPDGNGIEIYRDRPREEWRREGGELRMATLPLDLESVIAELHDQDDRDEHVPAGTRIGHVHLQVADLAETEAFYSGALGFDVVVRGYPGALFVSAGGYHHHIGLNTWHSAGSGPPPADAVGLRSFEVALPAPEELERTLQSLTDAGVPFERHNGSALVRDPSGNRVLLTTR